MQKEISTNFFPKWRMEIIDYIFSSGRDRTPWPLSITVLNTRLQKATRNCISREETEGWEPILWWKILSSFFLLMLNNFKPLENNRFLLYFSNSSKRKKTCSYLNFKIQIGAINCPALPPLFRGTNVCSHSTMETSAFYRGFSQIGKNHIPFHQ